MKITEIHIILSDEKVVKAYVDIIFDNCFIIKGIKIIQGKKLFVSMPSRRKKNGTFVDIAHPINNEFRLNMELQILKAYEQKLKKDEKSI